MEESISKGRPRTTGGTLYRRPNSVLWWVRYRNREGLRTRESTETLDQQEAERFLRKRLDDRDDGKLPIVLASKNLTFGEWAQWFLHTRSRPPFRSAGTHQQNVNAVKFLRPVFGNTRLLDIAPEANEHYIAQRLNSPKKARTKLGSSAARELKPATVHQEFRVLRRMLNIA